MNWDLGIMVSPYKDLTGNVSHIIMYYKLPLFYVRHGQWADNISGHFSVSVDKFSGMSVEELVEMLCDQALRWSERNTPRVDSQYIRGRDSVLTSNRTFVSRMTGENAGGHVFGTLTGKGA